MTLKSGKNDEIISKRWARALIEIVLEDGGISKEDILNDLKDAVTTVNSSEELSNVISNPLISAEEKQIIICKLFKERLAPVVYNFIYMLNIKKRLELLGEITEQFEKELERAENISHVKITSAIDLNEDQRAKIKDKISSKLKKEIDAEWFVDKEIIGGLVFNIDETIVDNSVRHKLENLNSEIIRG